MIISHKLQCIYIKLAKVASASFHAALKECSEGDIIKHPFKYKAHISARDIKERMPKDIWDNYLKVATIRCPYDMLISYYYFQQSRKLRQIDFEQFIAETKRVFKLIYGLHGKKQNNSPELEDC